MSKQPSPTRRIHLLGHANPIRKDIVRFKLPDLDAYVGLIEEQLARGRASDVFTTRAGGRAPARRGRPRRRSGADPRYSECAGRPADVRDRVGGGGGVLYAHSAPSRFFAAGRAADAVVGAGLQRDHEPGQHRRVVPGGAGGSTGYARTTWAGRSGRCRQRGRRSRSSGGSWWTGSTPGLRRPRWPRNSPAGGCCVGGCTPAPRRAAGFG